MFGKLNTFIYLILRCASCVILNYASSDNNVTCHSIAMQAHYGGSVNVQMNMFSPHALLHSLPGLNLSLALVRCRLWTWWTGTRSPVCPHPVDAKRTRSALFFWPTLDNTPVSLYDSVSAGGSSAQFIKFCTLGRNLRLSAILYLYTAPLRQILYFLLYYNGISDILSNELLCWLWYNNTKYNQ